MQAVMHLTTLFTITWDSLVQDLLNLDLYCDMGPGVCGAYAHGTQCLASLEEQIGMHATTSSSLPGVPPSWPQCASASPPPQP
jgi:hypothetical protein